MSKIAIIDIGSNSVRCLFVADGKTLYKDTLTARLGEGLALSGAISQEAEQRNLTAISQILAKAIRSGVEEIYAFATAAVRNSSNGREFVLKVKEKFGIQVDVLSGEQEAVVGITGALEGKDGGIIDIGGASTEITVAKGGKIVYSYSLPIGAVTLKDSCGQDKERLRDFVRAKIKDFGEVPEVGVFYAIGGTATALSARMQNLSVYDRNKVHLSKIYGEELESYIELLSEYSVEERINILKFTPKRAEVILGGAIVLSEIINMLKLSFVSVSENDNAEGYLALKTGGDLYAVEK